MLALKSGAIHGFTKEGYHGTTIKQIAKAADTIHTTFYQYFNGKAELIVAMGHDTEPALLVIAGLLDEGPERPFHQAVRDWLDDYDRMWTQHHAVFDAYWEALGERSDSDQAPTIKRRAISLHQAWSRSLIVSSHS